MIPQDIQFFATARPGSSSLEPLRTSFLCTVNLQCISCDPDQELWLGGARAVYGRPFGFELVQAEIPCVVRWLIPEQGQTS